MTDVTPKKSRLSDQKRIAIIEAAVAEFDCTGFDATSMDAIAARAQVSKRTVYNHFCSKEELFRAIKNELVRRAREVEIPEYDPQKTVEEQLLEIGRRIVSLVVSDEFVALARVTIPAFIHCPAFASEAFTEFEHSQQDMVHWIRQACEHGALRVEDVNRAAKQFSGLLETFTFWPKIVGGQQTPSEVSREEIVRSVVAMFLDHYRGLGSRQEGARD